MATAKIENSELNKPGYAKRGFLPEDDPLAAFPPGSRYAVLDEIGRDLPSLLYDKGFRAYARGLDIPAWQEPVTEENLPQLRLYYVRVGFLASAYVNQVGEEPAKVAAAEHSGAAGEGGKAARSPAHPELRRLRVVQLEALPQGRADPARQYRHNPKLRPHVRRALVHPGACGDRVHRRRHFGRNRGGQAEAGRRNRMPTSRMELWRIEDAVRRQAEALKRIPEHMDSSLYYKTFRPYIRFFENVTYEGVDCAPIQFRGETGAQSSIMPTLIAFMKIPHRRSVLTDHLDDMRNYMPARHRALIKEVETMPDIRNPQAQGALQRRP